ncbi:MAG: hypothetical protein LBI27_06655 [Clostridiales bacterium]|jgi:hypothetical protein|nr:hypothetical protein [Clostridiales bacterium]
MPENNLITKSIRKASSLIRYDLRVTKDTALHDDVQNFLLHRQESTSRLVDRLINNDFALARYTDPTYPA